MCALGAKISNRVVTEMSINVVTIKKNKSEDFSSHSIDILLIKNRKYVIQMCVCVCVNMYSFVCVQSLNVTKEQRQTPFIS